MGLLNLINAAECLVGLTETWAVKGLMGRVIPTFHAQLGGAICGGAGLTGS